jgi:hypothetical protein
MSSVFSIPNLPMVAGIGPEMALFCNSLSKNKKYEHFQFSFVDNTCNFGRISSFKTKRDQ